MLRRRLVTIAAVLAASSCARHEEPPAAQAVEQAPTPPTPTTIAADLPTVVRAAPPEMSLAWVRANSCAEGGPLSLTASDGTGLRLVSFDAHAVVEGPLAFTELRLDFDNPEARQIEGRFAIQLPPGAALSRFAMAIDGRWQEGEVVERQAARVAYEDALHRRQDPALLESGGGNRFEARVFPIPARARKQIVIGWSQALASSSEPYVLPVCGLPELDRLDVEVLVRAPDEAHEAVLHRAELHETDYVPKMDLELRTGGKTAPILRAGDLAVARVTPALDATPERLDALTILFDTSASRALDYGGQVDRLAALVAELGKRNASMQLRVIAFDQTAQVIHDGPVSGFDGVAVEALRKRSALGASDLAVGFAAAGKAPRVLYVGDGVFTAEAADRAAVLEILKGAARTHEIARFDALVDGGLQDRAVLEDLARGELERDGVVLDARVSVGQLVDKLERPTRSKLAVAVEGASWSWPQTVDGVQPGDQVLVYAQLPADRALHVQIGDTAIAEEGSAVASAPRPLLQRAKAQARIDELQGQLAALGSDGGDAAKRIRDEIVATSTQQRVLSDLTALLVLETEADYQRFGIERTALADVLTVGKGGIEVLARGGLPVDAKRPASPDKPEIANKGDVDKDIPTEEKRATASLERERDGGGGEAPGTGSLDGRLSLGDGEAGNREIAGNLFRSADAPPPPAADPAAPVAPLRRPPRSESAAPHDAEHRPDETRHRGDEGGLAFDEAPRGVLAPVEKPAKSDPYDGDLAKVMTEIAAGNVDRGLDLALEWRARAPGDVLALIGLGEAYEAAGDLDQAARAYGSIIDLFPARADLRRMAGERLERLGPSALPLAIDTYAQAVAQRPDHPSSHRLYAYALLKAGRHEEAFNAILAGLDREYPGGRFAEVQRILREDLGLVAAAWLHADPSREPTIARAVGEHHASIDNRRSLRFVLNWETDANDVDLHVYDGQAGHAWYSSRHLASGGDLYADVTTGYGPECFAVFGKPSAFPYTVQAHYYARGPMGYGMGKLQVIEHDGNGNLTFGEHPFVLMKDQAHVDLATLTALPSAGGETKAVVGRSRIRPRP